MGPCPFLPPPFRALRPSLPLPLSPLPLLQPCPFLLLQAEGSPLLSPSGARTPQRRTLLALAAVAAATVACIAVVGPRAGRTELQGDGVVPVSQLSFTKAEEAHFKGAKKMGDVNARSAMNRYFDTLGEQQQAEHKAALKRSFNKIQGDQSLNQWFNKMGNKYFRETQEEKAERKASHPGKLKVHRTAVYQKHEQVAAAAEDPDDVPMEKKESVEDRMIATVAEYQRKQKEEQVCAGNTHTHENVVPYPPPYTENLRPSTLNQPAQKHLWVGVLHSAHARAPRARAHTHTRTHTHIHTHTLSFRLPRACARAHTHVSTHTRSLTLPRPHVRTHCRTPSSRATTPR